MDMIGKIRRLSRRGKKSEREISRLTGLSRNTVAKWLHSELEGEPKYRRKGQPNKLTAFHETLVQALKADARRPKHEQSHLMPMTTPFDGYVEKPSRVSSTCLVSVARNRYSVPCEFFGQRVSTRLYPSSVVVVADDQMVACHERLSGSSETRYDWQHYIPLLQRKPGALRNGAPFADLPEPLQRRACSVMRR